MGLIELELRFVDQEVPAGDGTARARRILQYRKLYSNDRGINEWGAWRNVPYVPILAEVDE